MSRAVNISHSGFSRAPVGQEPYLVLAAMETDHEIVNHQVVFGRFEAQAQLFEACSKLLHLLERKEKKQNENSDTYKS